MHTTGAALAANLHHPRASTCVQKLARQKFRVSSYETIEKNRFWGLTPKPEAVATDSMGDL